MHVSVWILEARFVGDKALGRITSSLTYVPGSIFLDPRGGVQDSAPGSSNYPYVQVLILSDFPSSCCWVFPFPSTPCFLEVEPTSHPTSQTSMSLSSVTCLSLTFFNAEPVGPFLLFIGFPSYLQPLLCSFSEALLASSSLPSLLHLIDVSPLRTLSICPDLGEIFLIFPGRVSASSVAFGLYPKP